MYITVYYIKYVYIMNSLAPSWNHSMSGEVILCLRHHADDHCTGQELMCGGNSTAVDGEGRGYTLGFRSKSDGENLWKPYNHIMET